MNPQMFVGRDSARTYYAARTNQRSGAGFEITIPRKPLSRMAIEAIVLIAGGVVVLNLIGRVI